MEIKLNTQVVLISSDHVISKSLDYSTPPSISCFVIRIVRAALLGLLLCYGASEPIDGNAEASFDQYYKLFDSDQVENSAV